MPAGFHGVMTGAGVVFFAYLGFDMVSCLAEEVHEPQRTLPKGIIGSLLISMTIYVGVSLVVTGMAPVNILGDEVPLVNAFTFHDVPWAARLVSFGSIFGLTTAAFTSSANQETQVMDRFLEAARRVKPLSRCEQGSDSLKGSLTLMDLVAYGVGCSVGAGVYSLVGVGAQIAGPSISLSFLISGVACIFTSLAYSEFASRVPVSFEK